MNHPNIPIQEEPQLQLVEQSELASGFRERDRQVLNADAFGRIDPIKQGRHLLANIKSNLPLTSLNQQGVESADDLLESGERVLVDFEDLVLNISHETGGAALLPGLKKKERIEEKMDHEYEGDASRILDVVRGSVVFDSLESLYKAVEKLQGKAKIVAVEDRFEKPSSSGYRDIKFNLELTGEDGKSYIAELQFHLQGMYDFKKWETSLYTERRTLEGKRKKMKAKEGNPLEIRKLEEKIARLQDDAKSVYSQVWQNYKNGTTWN